jgi:hypothetical protein
MTTAYSSYHYDPTNCDNDNKCQGYSLRASLENEKDYLKKSIHSSAENSQSDKQD